MTREEFELTKKVFECVNNFNSIMPENFGKRPEWENRLYQWSEGFAKQIIDEFNKK